MRAPPGAGHTHAAACAGTGDHSLRAASSLQVPRREAVGRRRAPLHHRVHHGLLHGAGRGRRQARARGLVGRVDGGLAALGGGERILLALALLQGLEEARFLCDRTGASDACVRACMCCVCVCACVCLWVCVCTCACVLVGAKGLRMSGSAVVPLLASSAQTPAPHSRRQAQRGILHTPCNMRYSRAALTAPARVRRGERNTDTAAAHRRRG